MANEQNKQAASAASSTPAVPATAAPAIPAAPGYEQLMAMFVASQQQIAGLLQQQAEYNKQALKIAPRRKKTMAEYLAKNPRKFLKHDVYQNGHLVNPKGLSQATLDLLDTLASGVYCDGMIRVDRIKDGVDGISSRIHIRYNNKSLEQRMALYMRFPTFTKMVNDIAAEMKALGVAPIHEKGADAPSFDFPDEL